MSAQKIEAWVAAKKLPLGHVGRKLASRALTDEYALCKAQERKWTKSLSRTQTRHFGLLDENGARLLSDFLCCSLGEQKVKRIVFSSPDVVAGVAAHYAYPRREIHCKSNQISLATLVHEVTHHFGQFGHGKGFCEIEMLLFDQTMVWLEQQRKVHCGLSHEMLCV